MEKKSVEHLFSVSEVGEIFLRFITKVIYAPWGNLHNCKSRKDLEVSINSCIDQ